MRTLICGSLAYDTIMVFPDQLLAAHPARADARAVGVVPDRRDAPRVGRLRRQHRVQPEAHRRRAGRDGDGRRRRRRRTASGSRRSASASTACATSRARTPAQAFIITDLDDNQITAFHPGRDELFAPEPRRRRARTSGSASSRPTARRACARTSSSSRSAGIPFVFDPGQGMPLFDGPELVAMIEKARYVAVNDYEGAHAVPSAPAFRLSEIAERVEALIVTLGARRLGDSRRRRDVRDSRRQGRSGARSHRLRRRVSRRAAVRHRARLGLGAHRRPGLGAGRAQDRIARRAEPRGRAGRRVQALYRATFGTDLW